MGFKGGKARVGLWVGALGAGGPEFTYIYARYNVFTGRQPQPSHLSIPTRTPPLVISRPHIDLKHMQATTAIRFSPYLHALFVFPLALPEKYQKQQEEGRPGFGFACVGRRPRRAAGTHHPW